MAFVLRDRDSEARWSAIPRRHQSTLNLLLCGLKRYMKEQNDDRFAGLLGNYAKMELEHQLDIQLYTYMFGTSQLKIPFSIINSEILWLSNYVNCYCAICYILALPYTPLLALKSFELVWYHTTRVSCCQAFQKIPTTKFL